MIKYAILLNPGHNRVYFDQSARLAAAELEIALGRLSVEARDIKPGNISGTGYLTFETGRELDRDEAGAVWQVSSCYCLFTLAGRDKPLLAPVQRPEAKYFDPAVGGMLKYPGKTNELFTRLMINAAAWSSDFAGQRRLALLDPVAGKGTTLLEGLVLGCDVAGIEISERPAREFCVFFKKYLELGKYKHTYEKQRHGGDKAAHTAEIFEIARSKEDFRDGNRRQRAVMITGSSAYADRFLKKGWAHIIAGDLAYGIEHGNVSGGGKSSPSRNPSAMLTACLPAWHNTLKKGGAMALSWNTFLLPRAVMADLLKGAGFAVLDDGPYRNFEHRVDQAIKRDIVVARKE